MEVGNIEQDVTFKASPQTVYELLVDPKKHGAFTESPAEIQKREGGHFSYFGGLLEGFVLRLRPNKLIVLAWRSDDWPKDHFSIASFLLTKVKGGTKLSFSQYGVPYRSLQDIAQGWETYYWEPMKKYLQKK
jgi:activator of HSP90 ATPase